MLSYWSGAHGKNPIRYTGGLWGGAWVTSYLSALGNDRFDGAYLVQNFESQWKEFLTMYSAADLRPDGKKGLIIGIANDQSIAYACARAFCFLGAELAVTYLNEKARPFVEPLAAELEAPIFLPCDVRTEDQLEAVFGAIREGNIG